jgi:threonylcarbamoyladenosine tRNA methylthiotransferase MtaB
MPTFKIITLGCKVNQSESDLIAGRLCAKGWLRAADGPADLCIINTCTVTARASQQSRQAVGQAVRANPDARVVVTGCDARISQKRFQETPGVDEVIDPREKLRLAEVLIGGQRPSVRTRETDFIDYPRVFGAGRTRPFLKIQDGCDAFCSYCIVPYARGSSRSMPIPSVLKNIALLEKAGYREVVLCGIHMGCYGRDFQPRKSDLAALLTQIERESSIERVRLSSIEPMELGREIIALISGSRRFCPHFHVPLQSGDNEILKRMHRPYTAEQFSETILSIRRQVPEAAIGSDVLVGFPGEKENAFANTCRLIEALPIDYLHVFPFSPRTGTPAERFPDPVPAAVIKERCCIMRRLGRQKRAAFYQSHLGKCSDVLVESVGASETGLLSGLTSNYIPVRVEGPKRLKNTFIRVMLEKTDGSRYVLGTIVKI